VDIYGGDNAPQEIIAGCVDAMRKYKGFDIVMTGKSQEIKTLLKDYPIDDYSRIEICDAQEVITNDEVPTVAIRNKKNSSLVVALEKTKSDKDCIGMVSAGSTGAVLTGAFLKIGRIKGIQRPALAPILPTVKGGNVVLIDCGANVDCKANMLVQFALMGNAYAKTMLNIENPRVALLSNGTEDKKGNELTHEAFALLKQTDLNFVGNMEAREIISGDYDVIVCDGFWGNIALKSLEGAFLSLMSLIKAEIMSSFKTKIAGSMLKKNFKNIAQRMDYNKNGGAPFLGVEKLVIKSHGSSKAESICGSIMQVVNMHKNKLIVNLKNELPISEPADQTEKE
jgi:glycerol-3-phosphate acyltransferase PlsX